MSYFSLLEDFRQMSMLFEGIDDMRKFYKNIPENEFISYIELDPTYKQGSNKAGTYAKWILGLANNDNLKDKNHVKDLLSRYEENKKNLKDKDIMKFKSMDELESYLNNDENYNDLSHRQEVRQRQKDRRNVDLSKDAELVYEDSDWEVWIPKTYAASCKLGQGTSWCTASTETSEYYDDYTSDGDLYININKHDPKEKYQFHFKSRSYMDKDDEEIDIYDFFSVNEDLYKNYYEKQTDLGTYIKDIEEQIKTLEQNDGKFVYIGQDIPSTIRNLITNVVISDSVTNIAYAAFSGCESLTSVTIGNGVKSISSYAFSGCESLTSVYITDLESWCNIEFDDSYANPLYYAKNLYLNNHLLTELIIPNTVTEIKGDAFYNYARLTRIELPASLTTIGVGAFSHCRNLTSVVIPDSVTSIGSYAFEKCSSLTSVIIPDSITSIGYGAFEYCENLNEIKYTGSAKQWKQIKKGGNWANGVPAKSIKLVDSVGIDENFNRRNKHIQ